MALTFLCVGGCASLLGIDEPEFIAETNVTPGVDASDDVVAIDVAAPDAPPPADAGSDTTSAPDAAFTITGIIDDFNRPNSLALGNGWIEKTASAFDLVNGTADLVVGAVDYRDGLVYRQAGEEMVDVRIGATLTFVGTIGSAFIAARVQNPTPPQSFFGYYVIIANDPQMIQLIRHNGGMPVLVGNGALPNPLALNTPYRLVLDVKNIGSLVQLNAELRQLPSGTLLGTASAADTTPNRISTAGTVGFGGINAMGSRTRFDDYSRVSP